MKPRVLLLEPGGGPAMSRYGAGLRAALSDDFAIDSATARHFEPRGLLRMLLRRPEGQLARVDGEFEVVHATQVFLAPHVRRFGAARVVSVHDLMPRTFGSNRSYRMVVYRQQFERSRRHLRHADLVITPSESTRKELLAAGPLRPARVRVVPPCLPDEMRPDPGVARRQQTILSVGPTFSYKNVPLLLHALADPALRDARLVRVGRFRAEHRELAHALGLLPRIEECGHILDSELVRLYQTATVLAHPSFSEGFGLPVAEAMLCGLPVVVSDGGALPEVAGTAGRVVPLRSRRPRAPVDFDDVRDFARALAEVLADADERERMSAAGIEESARFRAGPVREQLLAAYAAAREFAQSRERVPVDRRP